MPAGTWTESFTVRPHEITPHGTASVPTLCRYLQEAAGHHAEALGVSIQQLQTEDRAWVLAHLRLTINRLPEWEESITVETWPSGLDRLYATREFVLRVDETPVARATSAWLVFDTERRRPTRPPERLHTIELPDRPPVLSHDWADLPAPKRTDYERAFDVRYHDLDVNRHVNNVRVLEWALETLPAEHLDTHRCADVALQFKGETVLGDSVRAVAQMDKDDETLRVRHALHHTEDDRTLAVARSRWVPRADAA